ncbi:MAG: helix-turn-helix domain-containing protein [Mangrovibacterium sp.]
MLRIKEILKRKDIQVNKLAEMIGLTPQNLSKLINEKTKPSIDTFEKIAKALDVPLGELFDQPQTDIINCPHCGSKIKVSKG